VKEMKISWERAVVGTETRSKKIKGEITNREVLVK